MKKIIQFLFTLFIISAFTMPVSAYDFYPRKSEAVSEWGIGVLNTSKSFIVYSEPDEKSKVLEKISWNQFGVEALSKNLSSKDIFMAFVPEKKVVLMNVVDELPEWCQVVYNQPLKLKGWVKKSDAGKFLTWFEFMNNYGKSNGVYVFHDIPQEYKKLRTNPTNEAAFHKDFYYMPDNIKLTFVKGNWMLVRFMAFDHSMTIGWTKWRDDEGKIYAFPNFDN